MIWVSCLRSYFSDATCRLGAAHDTCFGRHSGCSSASLASTVWLGSQSGSSLFTTKDATPPPPTPWQFAQSSDFVLLYSFDWLFANSTAPRSIDWLLNPSLASAPRKGS